MSALQHRMERTRQLCRTRLGEPDLQRVADATRAVGVNEDRCMTLVAAVHDTAASLAPVRHWKDTLERAGAGEAAAAGRYLLVLSALHALDALPSVPVGDSVKALFCDAFERLATLPADAGPGLLAVGESRFSIACKLVSLRRFPAGEFDWEVSGIPRSWVLRFDRRDLPKMLAMIAFRLRGFAPTFVSHLGLFRPTRSMSEVENNRSFYRMAEAMALQPAIRGWSGASWMRSPATHKISPNLAWINRTLLANGGVVTNIGPADPNGGVLAYSATRKQAYDAGRFRPMEGFGVWPRREMLAWAARHPELADPAPGADE